MVGTDEDDAYFFVSLNHHWRIHDFVKHRENWFYWCNSPSSLKVSNFLFSEKNREICEIWFPREINRSYQSSFFFGLTQKKIPHTLLMFSIQIMVNDLTPHWPGAESLYVNILCCSRFVSKEMIRDSFLDPVNLLRDQYRVRYNLVRIHDTIRTTIKRPLYESGRFIESLTNKVFRTKTNFVLSRIPILTMTNCKNPS